MQISTVDCDWLVDTLSLRAELHLLNEVFTDPQIVKVYDQARTVGNNIFEISIKATFKKGIGYIDMQILMEYCYRE